MAIAELRRVLEPGGAFFSVEHGHAPDEGVGRPATSRCGRDRGWAGDDLEADDSDPCDRCRPVAGYGQLSEKEDRL